LEFNVFDDDGKDEKRAEIDMLKRKKIEVD